MEKTKLARKIAVILVIFFLIETLTIQTFAAKVSKIEIVKDRIKDSIIDISSTINSNNEIIIENKIQGDYYKEENKGKYIYNVSLEYQFNKDILEYFDLSNVSNPNLRRYIRKF